MHQTVVQSVTLALDALVQSVEEGVPYEDLQALGKYVQWSVDFKSYETALNTYRVEMRDAEMRREATATMKFREVNGRLYEEVLWDWSPLWRIITGTENVLRQMPGMPWRHDGRKPYLNSFFLSRYRCMSEILL